MRSPHIAYEPLVSLCLAAPRSANEITAPSESAREQLQSLSATLSRLLPTAASRPEVLAALEKAASLEQVRARGPRLDPLGRVLVVYWESVWVGAVTFCIPFSFHMLRYFFLCYM